MLYRDKATGTLGSLEHIKRLHPNVSPGLDFAELYCDPVGQGDYPVDAAEYETVRALGVEQSGDEWVQTWIVHTIELEQYRARQVAKLSELRYESEVSGFDLGGVRVRTDHKTRGSLVEAKLAAMTTLGKQRQWKMANSWVTLTDSDLAQFLAAIDNHVQQAFDNESALSQQLAAAETHAEIAAIDLFQGWPE